MSTRSSSSSRGHTKARDEVIAMLKDDHKRAKSAFREFEKLDQQGDIDACRELAQRTCAELEVHTELEEQLFYPAVRDAVHDDDLMNEAEVEHMTCKMLIERLKSADIDDRLYAATFTVLAEYVKHHVKEEEGEMFKQLSRKRVDWPALLAEMSTRREELAAEKGLVGEIDDEAIADMRDSAAAGRSAGTLRRSGSRMGSEQRPQASSKDSKE